jgi:hypothetical protein
MLVLGKHYNRNNAIMMMAVLLLNTMHNICRVCDKILTMQTLLGCSAACGTQSVNVHCDAAATTAVYRASMARPRQTT